MHKLWHRIKWLGIIICLAVYGTLGFLVLPWFLATPLTLVMILTTRRPKKKELEEPSLSGLPM